MKVLFCAYREWATDVVNRLDKSKYEHLTITNNDHIKEKILNYNPDIVFFIGWSWIINEDIINQYECMCIHPSKLPAYRGGSPIQNQIIDGIDVSAVTLFKMNKKLDAGDIVFQASLDLSGELIEILKRISDASIEVITRALNTLLLGQKLQYVKQIESQASYCKRRSPEESEITLEDLKNKTAKQLYDKIRCLQDPYPNAYIKLGNGEKLYLIKSKIK